MYMFYSDIIIDRPTDRCTTRTADRETRRGIHRTGEETKMSTINCNEGQLSMNCWHTSLCMCPKNTMFSIRSELQGYGQNNTAHILYTQLWIKIIVKFIIMLCSYFFTACSVQIYTHTSPYFSHEQLPIQIGRFFFLTKNPGQGCSYPTFSGWRIVWSGDEKPLKPLTPTVSIPFLIH